MSQNQAAEACEGTHENTGYLGERQHRILRGRDINQPELMHGKHGLRIQASWGRYSDAICIWQVTKNTCSRQRGHRLVHASSSCLASTTRKSADQKQECVYQLLCRSAVLSEDIVNMIMPLRVITGSDHSHTSNFYVLAKRNCCKKWLVIQRQESS